MRPYEYFVLLIIVLIGLAISDVTISLHKLLVAGRRVRWHWAAPAIAFLSTVLVIGEFMSTWTARSGTVWFPGALSSVGLFVLLYLAAAAALPGEVPAEGLDLGGFYFDNRRHFWGLMTAFMAVQTLLIAINPLNRSLPEFWYVIGQDVLIALACALLIWLRRPLWHAIFIAAFAGLEILNWWSLKLG